MRRHARSAVSSSTAATAPTASPTIRTLSVQSASSSCDTGRMPNFTRGRSAPVMTAYTPGTALARVVSIPRMRACACGLRSSLPNAMRGRTRSSVKRVSPMTLPQASILGSGWPITLKRLVIARLRRSLRTDFYICRRGASAGLRRPTVGEVTPRWPNSQSGQLDRIEDLRVTGAAAEVAGERFADPLARRRGIVGEQRLRGEEDSRRAVAALGGAQLGERLLQRVQPGAVGHALDGRDLALLEVGRQRDARQHRRAVDEHGAGAALPELAAVLGADEIEVLAQHFEERLVDGHEQLARFAVDAEADANVHRSSPVSSQDALSGLISSEDDFKNTESAPPRQEARCGHALAPFGRG